MHAYQFTPGDTVLQLVPAWPWAIGYAIVALSLLAAQWITVPQPDSGPSGAGGGGH